MLTNENIESSAELLRRTAEGGNADAQWKLGSCLAMGQRLPVNYAEALKWYEKAAVQGHPLAGSALDWWFERLSGVPKEAPAAVEWYLRAVEQGDSSAENNLAGHYMLGRGVPPDFHKAAELCLNAAKKGLPAAENNLGLCYANGHGVPRDYREALKWFQKAAGQGLSEAQCNAGTCFDEGRGVERNCLEAVNWFRKAADQGHPIAQFNLGVCYENGDGVGKDYDVAMWWYCKAAENGDTAGERAKIGLQKKRMRERAILWGPIAFLVVLFAVLASTTSLMETPIYLAKVLGGCALVFCGIPWALAKILDWYAQSRTEFCVRCGEELPPPRWAQYNKAWWRECPRCHAWGEGASTTSRKLARLARLDYDYDKVKKSK